MRPDLALNALPLPDLFERLAATGLVDRLIALAADEDLGESGGCGDLTTEACVPPSRRAAARLVARGGGVMAGMACLPRLLKAFTTDVVATVHVADGAIAGPRQTVATLTGPQDEVLTLERTMLNIVGRLSGVATMTRSYADTVSHTRARVCDTRKTTPGMRVLEKYAVRCGGGLCHRIGLYDAVLIKDNHIAGVSTRDLPGFVDGAARQARRLRPSLAFIEVEVDSLEQFEALLTLPDGTIDIVLLDNMAPDQMRRAVALRDARSARLELEASGGVTLTTVRVIAETGVDRISCGALTHSAPCLDVALDM
ncbi:MAG: carboxylating nicotinate-nucleotide diphosphorylase [Phycisphaerales bacterium]